MTIPGFTSSASGNFALVIIIPLISKFKIVVSFGLRIQNINIPFLYKIGLPNAFSIILTIGWIVGITNAINLIDGLDGLSSGIALISCISMLVIFALNGSPIIAILLMANQLPI